MFRRLMQIFIAVLSLLYVYASMHRVQRAAGKLWSNFGLAKTEQASAT